MLFFIFSDCLFAGPIDFQRMKYGMYVQEIEELIGNQIRTDHIMFLSNGKHYFLDTVKVSSSGLYYSFLFEDGRLYTVNSLQGSPVQGLTSCFDGRDTEFSLTSVCIKKVLKLSYENKIDFQKYNFVPMEGPSWFSKLVGYTVGVPIAIAALPLLIPWIVVGDQPPSHPVKRRRVFDVPKLGERKNMKELYAMANIEQRVGDNLTIPASYVKNGKAAFGIESGEVIWILDCKFRGKAGVCE